ncbi:hypothetical protein RUM44_007759 [Polyplax serrata]|uniref:Synembryn n=1 Tax=Polyplax serrata TaxID=468196 RepID=A0ABR1B884_POLSC
MLFQLNDPIKIHEDNSAAIDISKNGNLKNNSKHIEVHYHYVHENIKKNSIEVHKKSRSKQELLSPILTVLLQMIKQERLIRKYLRHRILPPLRDVMTRPEEGNSLRAKLCRLLTSPSSTVKDLTAEFLYTLCKENVARMIKYTGYGNAAGLFANRGILFGNNRSSNSQSSYSSDSDSETEEYARFSDHINPVIGCYEPSRPNPMEGMSEEQKEYEAVKLANMLDKLSRDGVIQPCRVGEDGRPHPVQHVLQLQENLPHQQVKPPKK